MEKSCGRAFERKKSTGGTLLKGETYMIGNGEGEKEIGKERTKGRERW